MFNEPFNGPGLPAGWTSQPDSVELMDNDGNGTGVYNQEPWGVSNASTANINGYFPAPDQPAGNTFAAANDDASPCNCDLSGTALISPLVDLSGVQNAALSVRVFHDGFPFNTDAWIEASTDASAWSVLEEVPAVAGAWQWRLLDLGAYDGGPLYLRFRFDDNGAWASGFAVDDVCVLSRAANDIALAQAWLGDVQVSPFNTSMRSLGYTRLPVEQQSGLIVSARVRNLGMDTATAVNINGTLTLNGADPQSLGLVVCDTLLPLQETLVSWNSGLTNTGPGLADVALTLSMAAADDQSGDNGASLSYHLTDATQGGSAMALDNDLPTDLIDEGGAGFSTGCRYEMIGGSSIHGVSVRFGTGTTPGATVKAVLSGPSFDVLATASDHVITEADLALSFAGGTVFLPLDAPYEVSADQDVLAFVRFDGDTGNVYMVAGGDVPTGAAIKVAIDGLGTTYPQRAPIVRIHLSDPVTAVQPVELAGVSQELRVFPNPASSTITLSGLPEGSSTSVRILDASGRVVLTRDRVEGPRELRLEVSQLSPGCYSIVALSGRGAELTQIRTTRMVVVAGSAGPFH